MPVIVLAGEEEFALNKRLNELKTTLLSPAWREVNLIKLYKPSLASLRESTITVPFGQGSRIILVDNCDLFTKKRAKVQEDKEDNASTKSSKNSSEDDWESILTSIPDKTYLIFACPYNFDSTLKISKTIAKYAEIEEFGKEKYFPGSKNIKLESFCRQEAKRHNATIKDTALEYLLMSTEGDLRQLANEIEKTALSILPRTDITYEDVALLCTPHGNVFRFIDFWLNKQTDQALSNLSELLAQQNFMPILATIQTMLSKWIRIKALYENYSQTNKNNSAVTKQIALDLKLMPFSVEKDLRRLQKFTAAQLVDKRLQLTRLEYAIKVGQIPGDHALAMFISST